MGACSGGEKKAKEMNDSAAVWLLQWRQFHSDWMMFLNYRGAH